MRTSARCSYLRDLLDAQITYSAGHSTVARDVSVCPGGALLGQALRWEGASTLLLKSTSPVSQHSTSSMALMRLTKQPCHQGRCFAFERSDPGHNVVGGKRGRQRASLLLRTFPHLKVAVSSGCLCAETASPCGETGGAASPSETSCRHTPIAIHEAFLPTEVQPSLDCQEFASTSCKSSFEHLTCLTAASTSQGSSHIGHNHTIAFLGCCMKSRLKMSNTRRMHSPACRQTSCTADIHST